MVDVRLRAMTQAEYDEWVPRTIEAYAADHKRNGTWPAGQELDMARKQFALLLPDGPNTASHHLLVGTADGERVGLLWLWIDAPDAGSTSSAFVYDVEVEEAKRGKGFGRSLMLAAEDFAREHNATAIKLHVFGDNAVAIRLYEALGYQPTSISMAKPLTAPPTG